MSDLAEFLLARIAEDESVAREFDDHLIDERYSHERAMWLHPRPTQARILADCTARRRIVEADPHYGNPWDGCGDDCEVKAHEWMLRNLATVYADHPHYRPEWRPTRG